MVWPQVASVFCLGLRELKRAGALSEFGAFGGVWEGWLGRRLDCYSTMCEAGSWRIDQLTPAIPEIRRLFVWDRKDEGWAAGLKDCLGCRRRWAFYGIEGVGSGWMGRERITGLLRQGGRQLLSWGIEMPTLHRG